MPRCGINIRCQPLISLLKNYSLIIEANNNNNNNKTLSFTVSAGWSVDSHLVAARAGQRWLVGGTWQWCGWNRVTGWNLCEMEVQPVTKQLQVSTATTEEGTDVIIRVYINWRRITDADWLSQKRSFNTSKAYTAHKHIKCIHFMSVIWNETCGLHTTGSKSYHSTTTVVCITQTHF